MHAPGYWRPNGRIVRPRIGSYDLSAVDREGLHQGRIRALGSTLNEGDDADAGPVDVRAAGRIALDRRIGLLRQRGRDAEDEDRS